MLKCSESMGMLLKIMRQWLSDSDGLATLLHDQPHVKISYDFAVILASVTTRDIFSPLLFH